VTARAEAAPQTQQRVAPDAASFQLLSFHSDARNDHFVRSIGLLRQASVSDAHRCFCGYQLWPRETKLLEAVLALF
jgi:hypothetical protein